MRMVGHPEVIDEPWFASGAQRAQHADLLDGYVGDFIANLTRDEVAAAFEEAGAAVAPVYDARDLTEDPHVRATEMLTLVPDPDLGEVLQHNVMWRMSQTPGRIRFTGRAKGADTAEILQELGYTPAQQQTLTDNQTIA